MNGRFAQTIAPLSSVFCLLALGLIAQAAPLDAAIRDCKAAATAADKLAACSFVIARTSDPAALARAYNRRGHANIELGRYAEAVRDFSEVIRLNPDVAGYYDNRQNALRQLGRLDEALRDANIAVRLAPTYTFVLRGRANVYDDMGRQDLAIADFTRAIAMDPKDAGLRADRAKLYAKVGHAGDAFTDLTNAIALDPANAGLLKQRGLLMAGVDRSAARGDLVDYLAREPGDAEAIQALAALNTPPVRAPTPSPPPPAPIARTVDPDRREAEALDAKKKLVAEAVSAHEDCLMSGLVDITPYSNETAPTIVDVVIDRCGKFAERRIAIGIAAYDMTREQAASIVERKVAELRTKMISVIVTVRAEAAKKSAEPAPDAETTSQGLPKGRPL